MPRKAHRKSQPDPRESLLEEMTLLGQKLEKAVKTAITSKEAAALKVQARRAAKAGAAAGADTAEVVAKNISKGISALAANLTDLADKIKKAKKG